MTQERAAADGGLDSDLGWALGALFRAYAKSAEHVLSDLPGGPRGYQVLTAAVEEPPRNQGAIAEGLGIDRTVLTYLIDDLERADLVTRRPDPADRRSRLVTATAEGRASWTRHRTALRRVESHLLTPLPVADADAFLSHLRTLATTAQSRDPLTDLCEAVAHLDLPGDGDPA